MSAGFGLAVDGALLKLFVADLSSFASNCSSDNNNNNTKKALPSSFLCCSQQSLNLGSPTFSMRLRPIRTCSGVECFGGFHIKRFFYLFLFLRGPLT